jgi:CRISPR-associated protein Cst1
MASILALSGKHSLSKLTEKDLDKVADYIAEQYVVNPLKSFLNVAFPNSGYTQPAFEKQPERRQDYARRVARAYKSDVPVLDERCVFTGAPAVAIAFSDKEDYPLGRAFRQHIPMLTGEDVINFHPGGDAGLPVSGIALLCIQALPLGCAKCGGKLLAVHSDNAELMFRFAKKFYEQNRIQVDLARAAGSTKLPESKSSAKTLLIETFIEIERARLEERDAEQPFSVTACHLSNSGQSNPLDTRNPPLEIYHLPHELTGFLGAILTATYKDDWNKLSQHAWQLSPAKKPAKQEEKSKRTDVPTQASSKDDSRPRRNYLYEDLFLLPENVRTFIRRYFLRIPARNLRDDDPRRAYTLKDELNLVSWKLTQLFLERVMRMDANRIQLIRDMGDQLATYVHEENDQRFFMTFYTEQNYSIVRNALIRVNHTRLKHGQPPIVKFDSYIDVFEDVDERGRTDWKLARDLVLIRMIERLYEMKWLESHLEAIPEMSDDKVNE